MIHTHTFSHRQPKLCGSSLDFEFTREWLKINKIRPEFHFSAKIEIKMTYLVFVNVDKTASKCSTGEVNNKTQTQGISHFYFCFCRKMKFRKYFVHFHTFSWKFKVQRTPTEFGLAVVEQLSNLTDLRQHLKPIIQILDNNSEIQLISFSELGPFFSFPSLAVW